MWQKSFFADLRIVRSIMLLAAKTFQRSTKKPVFGVAQCMTIVLYVVFFSVVIES